MIGILALTILAIYNILLNLDNVGMVNKTGFISLDKKLFCLEKGFLNLVVLASCVTNEITPYAFYCEVKAE